MMLFLLSLFLILFAPANAQNSLSVANRSINAVTSYQLKLTFDFSTLSPSGKLTITFPSAGYSSSQILSSACSPYSCQVSGRTLTINNTLIPSTQNISITINNIVNPPSTMSIVPQNLGVTFNTAAGNTTSNISLGTFTAGALRSCSISFSTNAVNTYSTATITVSNSNPISNGYIQITLPSFWSGSASNSSAIPVSTPVTCGSNMCNYTSSFFNILTVFNITASANSSFSVLVSTLLSPPISVANSQITVATVSSDANSIDTSVSCSIPPLNPKTITISSNISTSTVFTSLSPLFTYLSPDPIRVNDTIVLSVSNLITTLTTSPLNFASNPITSPLPITTSNSTSYQYTIVSSNSNTIIPAGNTINMSGLTFRSGFYSTTVPSAFVFTLFRNGYSYQTGTLSFTSTPNTISSISVASSISTVQVPATATLQFTTITPLIPSSMIVITIPNTISTFSCGNFLSINSTSAPSFTCATINTTNIQGLLITNFASVPLNPSVINIRFNITNPMAVEASVFGVTSLYNSVDFNQSNVSAGVSDRASVTYTPTPSTLTCSVTPSTQIIGALAVYSIRCTTQSTLLSNGRISITIPSQILVPSSLPSVQIRINNVNTSLQYTISSQIITITNYLSTSLPPSSVILINVTSLINPQTFAATHSFSISFLSSASNLISRLSDSMAVTMSQPATFGLVNVEPFSLMNGEQTVYKISFTTTIDVYTGYYLTVSVPSSVTVATIQCITAGFTCSNTMNQLTFAFVNPYPSNSTVSIQISGFTNPRTYSSTGQFNFTIYNSAGIVYQSGIFSGFSNTMPNSITSFTRRLLTPNQDYLNSLQTLQFNVITKNPVVLSNGEYLNLLVPSSFTGQSLSCLPIYSCSLANNIIKISSTTIPSSTNFTFTVVNLRTSSTLSAMQAGTAFFTISSFTANNTPIDTSNSSTRIEFILSCDPICQTCQVGNPSKCLSCYSNASLLGNDCNPCALNQFKDNSTGLCSNCSVSCKTCIYSPSNCTSCNDGLYFVVDHGTCVSAQNCPTRTLPLNSICQSCSQSCYQCQNSTTECLSCSQNYIKRNTTSSECVSECDNGLVKYNGYCQCFQCLTCSGVYTNCTSCDPSSGRKYLYNNSCIESCPRSTYLVGSMCLPCPDGCQSCTINDCLDEFQKSLGNKIIPIPFTLGALVIVVLAILSKIICSSTFLPSFIIALGGVLQIISWIVLLAIIRNFESTRFKQIGVSLIAVGVGINYLLNFTNLFLVWRYLMKDKAFSFWFRKQSSKINNRITLIMSGVFHHRYIHLLFCKAFNSQNLCGPLQSPRSMIPIYAISGLGFLAEIMVISGCANIAYDPKTYSSSQLFIECIDIIILNLIMIIFTSWNFIKPDGFFKPVEISKYQDKDVFINNETIEDLRDKYLENLEIQQVTGGFGGKPKYSYTRLHLQGMDQKSLQKSKHNVVSNTMSKYLGDDTDSVMAHKLISKVVERMELEGISESSEEFGHSRSSEHHPLSPQKQHQRPRVDANMTDFEQKNEKRNKQGQDLDEGISISNDSLVRYQIPLDFEQADIIFAPSRDKSPVNLQKGKEFSENQENSLTQKFNINPNTASNIAKRIKRKKNKTNTENDGQEGSDLFSNSAEDSAEASSQERQAFTLPEGYDHDEVPERPTLARQREDYQSSTNLDNIPNLIQDQSHHLFPTKTLYHSKSPTNHQSQQLRNHKTFNQTTNQFFRKKKFSSHELQEEQESQIPTINQNPYHLQPKQLHEQFMQSNPHLPYHKFQRYLDEDSGSIFDSQSNQLISKKQTISSSVGSIKKNNNLRDQDITRQVVSKHILAPETPMRIPNTSISNQIISTTEPLATIAERPFIGSIKVQNPMFSEKLKGVQKIYLQKLHVRDPASSKKI